MILHGWGSNSLRWQSAGELISQYGYRVIIPDLPGFGESESLSEPWDTDNYADFAEKFISYFDLKDFYLLGHSFGGAIAVKISIKHAQDIKKLFLVSAALIRKKTAKKNFFSKAAKVAKLFRFLPHYGLIRKAVYKFIIRKSDYAYVEGVMKKTYLNIISEDLSLRLPFIKTPVLIIWGNKDEATPVEQCYFIHEQIKNSKLELVMDAGHDLNVKKPELLVEAILQNI